MSLHLFPAKPNQSRSSAVPRLLVLKNQESNRHNPKGKGGVVPMGHVQSTESSENYPGPAQQRGRLRREEETRDKPHELAPLRGAVPLPPPLCALAAATGHGDRAATARAAPEAAARRGEEAGCAWWAASRWLAWPRRWATALLKSY